MFQIPLYVRSVPAPHGVTVFNVKRKEALSLNPVGSLVWLHLQDGDSFLEVVEAVASATSTGKDLVERDIWAFIHSLINKGLVSESIDEHSKGPLP